MRLGGALALGLAFAGAHAQTSLREVSGSVTDQHNEPLRGAIVFLENESTLQVITYVTDNSGAWVFKRVDADTDYQLWASYRGVLSPKRNLSKFNSKSAPAFHLVLRLP